MVVLSIAGCSRPVTKSPEGLPGKAAEGVVEKGTTVEPAKDVNEGPGVTKVEVPASGGPKGVVEPNDVLVSFGDKKLTMENIRWRLPVPKDSDIYVLARTWLETKILYAEVRRRGITEEPRAQFFADLNAEKAYADELQRQVKDAVKVSDEAVQAYYDKNKDTLVELMEPGRLDFVHVRTATPAEAEAALAKVKSGTAMEDVAKMVSTAPDGNDGGVVMRHPYAWVQNELGTGYLSALKAAKDGDLIGPIAVDIDGVKAYEIARKIGESGGGPIVFDKVKEKIRDAISKVEQGKAWRELVDSLEKQAGSTIVKSPRLMEIEQASKEKSKQAGRTEVPTQAAPAPEGGKSGK
jgi:hypothetical protein